MEVNSILSNGVHSQEELGLQPAFFKNLTNVAKQNSKRSVEFTSPRFLQLLSEKLRNFYMWIRVKLFPKGSKETRARQGLLENIFKRQEYLTSGHSLKFRRHRQSRNADGISSTQR